MLSIGIQQQQQNHNIMDILNKSNLVNCAIIPVAMQIPVVARIQCLKYAIQKKDFCILLLKKLFCESQDPVGKDLNLSFLLLVSIFCTELMF